MIIMPSVWTLESVKTGLQDPGQIDDEGGGARTTGGAYDIYIRISPKFWISDPLSRDSLQRYQLSPLRSLTASFNRIDHRNTHPI